MLELHRDRVVTLYAVHSWAGVLFAVLIFIVCTSGAVAVFGEEIDHWSNPALRAATGPVEVTADEALARLTAVTGQAAGDGALLGLPQPGRAYYSLPHPRPEERLHRVYLDATSGALMAERQSHLYWYLRHLHVRLLSPWNGRLFVGMVGLAMLLSIVTGVLIHRHLFRDLFRLRWRPAKGGRTLMAELHKWVGVWGLVFHLMIALTGTWLALAGYLSPALEAARGGARPVVAPAPPALRSGPPPDLATLIDAAVAQVPGLVPTFLRIQPDAGDGVHVTVHGNLPDTLVQHAVTQVRFRAADGALLSVHDARTAGFWVQFRDALEPLHYGYFGGFWLKLLYLLMGLMPALLSLTGALIWFDRRQRLRGGRAVVPTP